MFPNKISLHNLSINSVKKNDGDTKLSDEKSQHTSSSTDNNALLIEKNNNNLGKSKHESTRFHRLLDKNKGVNHQEQSKSGGESLSNTELLDDLENRMGLDPKYFPRAMKLNRKNSKEFDSSGENSFNSKKPKNPRYKKPFDSLFRVE